ncbi:MAG: 50S ribosomal protein L10 [Candidatus Doudnabacteria bacterium RIFCSPHIGHO2_02_FULL_46_11]|uniref:Large ribosomal subunit protein uL10 n=1 Tax=Candidatus Doudnabacteria bacterium RIFCSPHIGHO2_02_FULL_46_11 TaxID=1817832 RepID=A0A1F5P7Y7_9BACT|nr:MAG: 50S ribosomal protein L10 [Candidatus Doudnabacteria bacterium RIFCSPHIGHO2_02_FULL_46_11]
MAKTRVQKEQTVSELTDILKNSKGVVFADYRGLSVKEISELRKRARAEGTKVLVAKLTLVRKALKDAGLDINLDMEVPTAMAYSMDDEVTPAKILAKFAADTKKLELLAGIFEGKLLGSVEIKALSKLPGKQELRGQVVSVIAGPMRGLVLVMSGVQRSLLYALKAIVEKTGTTA